MLGGFRAAIVPAKLGHPAHPSTGSDGQRTAFEIADHHAGLQQLDARGFLDVAFELAADRDLVGAHAAGQFRSDLDGDIALDLDVALELAGNAYAAATFD